LNAELLAIERGIVALEGLKKYRENIGFPQAHQSVLFTDSKSAIESISNISNAHKTPFTHRKFWRVQNIRDRMIQNKIVLEYVSSTMNCAEVLNKPLRRILHRRHNHNNNTIQRSRCHAGRAQKGGAGLPGWSSNVTSHAGREEKGGAEFRGQSSSVAKKGGAALPGRSSSVASHAGREDKGGAALPGRSSSLAAKRGAANGRAPSGVSHFFRCTSCRLALMSSRPNN
jgi:hypothetical protein